MVTLSGALVMPGAPRGPRNQRRVGKLATAVVALLWASDYVLGHNIRTYPGEKIGWRLCGQVKDREVECSDINVPMDQFDAHNSGDKTFNLPLIRMRGHNATENLVLNPGGPGESGLAFIYTNGAYLHDVVGDGFHLLSFDPRGVNRSRPAARCYPNKETRKSKFRINDPDAFTQSKERYAWTHNYVQGCVDNMGEHGKYINTPQTAADMNSILNAVGQQRMVFWGFSYGTLLGQTYAALFPERVSRVIIDGVTDYFDWYESRILRGDFIDTMNVFDGFFEQCVQAGDRCELASRARNKGELRQLVLSFLHRLKTHPIPVYINATTQGILNHATMLNGAIYSHLFNPSTWHTLAHNLAQVMDGNVTEAYLRYGSDEASDTIDEANDIIDLNDGLSGPAYWPQGRQALIDFLMPWYKSSPFFFQMNREYYAKQQWPIPKTHNFVPRRLVQTSHPLLVVSTTYDPVCPLVSAKVAREVFRGSSLVEIKGYGHCSLALPSSCLARHVRAYLQDGTLPDYHTTCEPDRPYFHQQERGGAAQLPEDRTGQERIFPAQVVLSDVTRRRS
ncbi:alpha/beta hydrolase fold domain-containing protein [Hirsutella rhossiliensis]|uniref:Alpha/beta hydrolase fold domain-containing protein n=1 Tax=Hirsutella rhossiliensis TaxID=111463 RepID=A0A9P8MQ97_9HYPO|nr:alpha/beta hydrolase fold domain-containing protein [Hirsutella rhossiliensis]KAH0958211.1 alpha/beta hydrolase fold domain-containing protein [Hirsutella rhossiliensis]